MGMDLNGLAPTIRKESDSTILKQVGHCGDEGWYDRWEALSEEDKDRYFQARTEYEENNPGVYFRNNVWYWRPLWNYVYSLCHDFISKERFDSGHNNCGEQFTHDEAKTIARRIRREINNGNAEAYVQLYTIGNETNDNMYPCDVDNMREFADFCHDSGGFEIC